MWGHLKDPVRAPENCTVQLLSNSGQWSTLYLESLQRVSLDFIDCSNTFMSLFHQNSCSRSNELFQQGLVKIQISIVNIWSFKFLKDTSQLLDIHLYFVFKLLHRESCLFNWVWFLSLTLCISVWSSLQLCLCSSSSLSFLLGAIILQEVLKLLPSCRHHHCRRKLSR